MLMDKFESDPELIAIRRQKRNLSRFPRSSLRDKRMQDLHTLVILQNQRKRQIIEQHATAFGLAYSQLEIDKICDTEVFDAVPDGINLAPQSPPVHPSLIRG